MLIGLNFISWIWWSWIELKIMGISPSGTLIIIGKTGIYREWLKWNKNAPISSNWKQQVLIIFDS